MDDCELRVRCMEAAVKLAEMQRPVHAHDVKGVVEIARTVYDFCNAPQQGETPAVTEDKPRRGRPPKAAVQD